MRPVARHAAAERTVPRHFSFTTRPYLAVDEMTGERIGLDEIEDRVGWLLGVISVAGRELLERLWQPATFNILNGGRDHQDRRLPAHGHVVAARLGWQPAYPDGIYVPSRVSRVVTTQVVSTLRTLAFRDAAIGVISARFDGDRALSVPSAGVDVALPPGFVRGVVRQLAVHTAVGNPHARNLRITDVQGPPQLSEMAQLSAADRQLAQLAVTDNLVELTVQLPMSPAPRTRAHWRRVRLRAVLPRHLRAREITDWHLPTLVMDRRGMLWRCAATEMVTSGDPAVATAAVGVDWSPSTLGAAALVGRDDRGMFSDFRGWTYGDRGLGVKLTRLQIEDRRLQQKSARLTQLTKCAPAEVRMTLETKIAVLAGQRAAVGAKRKRVNRELAFHFARQITDYGAAAGARLIAIEDLATFEPRGRGRYNNERATQSARGRAAAALTHIAAGKGITVVAVPARGSSALCPSCDRALSRPDGYHSAWCSRCEVGGNRDHLAAINLAKRALLGKSRVTRRDRHSGNQSVRRSRNKHGPTPPRPRHRRVRHSSHSVIGSKGVTSRRNVPVPQASVRDTVEPAVSQHDAGSRDTRTTPMAAASPVVGMRGS